MGILDCIVLLTVNLARKLIFYLKRVKPKKLKVSIAN